MWKLSGFFVQKNSKRKYNYSTAANLFGYISEVNDYEIKNNTYYKSVSIIFFLYLNFSFSQSAFGSGFT